MKTMTIRNVTPEVRSASKRRAVEHGHSADLEVRLIFAAAARRPHLSDVLLNVGARLQALPGEAFEVPRDKRPMALKSFK